MGPLSGHERERGPSATGSRGLRARRAPAARRRRAGGDRARRRARRAAAPRRGPAGGDRRRAAPPAAHAALLERVFSAYGIPFSLQRRVPAGHTALGRGVLALLRCALLDGDADELLTLLRTPGFLQRRRPGRRAGGGRRAGADCAPPPRPAPPGRRRAASRWRCSTAPAPAHARGPAALCAWLGEEVGRLFAAPLTGRAPVLDAAQEADARVAAALRRALAQLAGWASAPARPGQERPAPPDPRLVPEPEELVRLLAELPVRIGRRPGPDRVTVADPLAIRARRVRALFVCGLQEGAFPAPRRPSRSSGTPSGARSTPPPACAWSSARTRSAPSAPSSTPRSPGRPSCSSLSWHDADDDGEPAVRSLFVDDVLDLLPEGFADAGHRAPGARRGRLERRRRWPRRRARPPARPRAPPRPPATSTSPRCATRRCSPPCASARSGRPARSRPGSPARSSGSSSATSPPTSSSPTPSRWSAARWPTRCSRRRWPATSPAAARARSCPQDAPVLRRLAAEALARHAARLPDLGQPGAAAGGAAPPGGRPRPLPRARRPRRLGATRPPASSSPSAAGRRRRPSPLGGLRCAGGSTASTSRADGTALLYDYKGATAAPQARWLPDGKLQLALYMLALPHLLGLEAVGGLYQPLGGSADPQPRGLVREEADPGQALVRTRPPRRGRVRRRARRGARRGPGRRSPRSGPGASSRGPATCGWRGGGCSHPSVCRAEGL